MFDKEYSFRGRHAEKVRKLTADFDKEGNKLFKRNYDVYLLAPIVGFLYNIKSELDKDGEPTKIFPEILIKNKDDLLYNYRLIMLLDKNYCDDFDERVNKAFRYYGKKEADGDIQLFEQYVRGGVDKIYEKLMENALDTDTYLRNMFEFVEEIEERYNQNINSESIIDLCKLARS